MNTPYTQYSARLLYAAVCACLLAYICVPGVTHGYFTTNQEAVALRDNVALYTVSYAFGSDERDFYMPIMAVRDLAHDSGTENLGFEILEGGDTATTTGTAVGLVLSNAEIIDGMYKVPKGYVGKFTLVVLYSVTPGNDETDYALHVQELPFKMGTDKEYQHLNETELQYYVTKKVELNTRD